MVQTIDTVLFGSLPGTRGNDLFFATEEGIAAALIQTGAGSDTVIGNNISNRNRSSGINASIITFDGTSNTVIANGSLSGINQSNITLAGDNNTVIANGGGGIGIIDATINGSDGADTITAAGSSRGVQSVSLDGKGGNDIFNIGNGTGSVTGGDGTDLLILDGLRSDYEFLGIPIGDSGFGNIANTSSSLPTFLNVIGIENFQFAGESDTFTFDDLFGDGTEPEPEPEPVEITGTSGADEITPTNVSQGVTGGTPSDAPDIINGNNGNDTIDGGGGDDTLDGGNGSDIYVFTGDNGEDTIVAFANGADLIDLTDYNLSGIEDLDISEEGNNTVISGYNGAGNTITLENFSANDLGLEDFIFSETATVIVGTLDNDNITPNGVSNGVSGGIPSDGDDIIKALGGEDTVDGGGGDDVIDGAADADILEGGAGNDVLAGGNGDDILNGGSDNDLLRGDGGADTLDGGEGDDTLEGGGFEQAEVFIFSGNNGNDIITDFENGFDLIDLTAYNVSDVSDFTISENGDNTIISDYNGAGNTITLENFDSANLSNEDFILSESESDTVVDTQLTGDFVGTSQDDVYVALTSGIINASFDTKEGSDTILGTNFNVNGAGISSTTISSGDDADTITAIATGAIGIGMDDVTILAGIGDDVITAQGTLLGVQDVVIDGGGGNNTFDLGSGTGVIIGGLGQDAIDTLILDGTSADYTFTEFTAAFGNILNDDLGTDLNVFNVDLFTFDDDTFTFTELFSSEPPDSGDNDSRRGFSGETIEGGDLDDFYEATFDGILASTFDTFAGNDTITSFLDQNSANNNGAIAFTRIDTGEGEDTVTAEAEVGIGIRFTEINTGDDADTITGISTGDVGMDTVSIDAGDGDDLIVAQGGTFSVVDSLINGGEGNDTVDLRGSGASNFGGRNNGTRTTINGGSGDGDLLILGGASDQYNYQLGSSTDLTGTISINTSEGFNGTTNLDVQGVENFRFADELSTTFTFNDLFVA